MATVEHGVSKYGQVFGGREQAGVSGDTAQDAGIFVLHLSLDDAMAKRAIVGSGRDRAFQDRRWIESRARHAQRTEDFTPAERIKRFVRQSLQRDPEKDKSDVAVCGVCTGSGHEFGSEYGLKQFAGAVHPQE